ncbi:MAG: tetratricopeptide repeat protein [Desulfotalea sp.]
MKIKICLTTLILVFTTTVNSFSSTLTKIDRTENQDKYNIYLSFDSTPSYVANQTGRRLELILENADSIDNISLPEVDDKLIKLNLKHRGDNLYLTLYFRYKPQVYNVIKISQNKLFLEIKKGNTYSASLNQLAQKFKNIKEIQGTAKTLTPLNTSPYRNDWKFFFTDYQPEIQTNIPIRYTWPPFPIIQYLAPRYQDNLDIIPPELLESIQNNNWSYLTVSLPAMIKDNSIDIETKKLLALSYGEALAKAGDYESSYKQIYLLREKYPNTGIANLCHYLLLMLESKYVDPYIANIELDQVEKKINPQNPLMTYLDINRIETALAAGDLPRMNELLIDDDLALPKELETRHDLRQADYWYSLKQPIKAAAAYRLAKDNSKIIDSQPFSLNGYCESLFLQKKMKEAKDCYYELRSTSITDENLSIVNYKLAIAKNYLTENPKQKISNLAVVADTYSTLIGGARALIKRYDLEILNTKQNKEYKALGKKYLQVAKEDWPRLFSEECYLKAAIAFYLAGDALSSIKTVEAYQDKFKVGKLSEIAVAFLIQIIPPQVQALADAAKDKEIIILLQKHRSILLKQWFGDDVAEKLGLAYYNLGLYKEANKIFTYLLNTSIDASKIYLPLIKSTYDLGEYDLVINYASRFGPSITDPKEKAQIEYHKSKSLYNMGESRIDTKNLSNNNQIELAAQMAYASDKFQEVINILQDHRMKTDEEKFWYAESLFQVGKKDEALGFLKEIEGKTHQAQCSFRIAEIFLSQGKNDEAIQKLKELKNKHPNSSWTKLAEIELSSSTLKSLKLK